MHLARPPHRTLRSARALSVVAALVSFVACVVASAADEVDLELSPPRMLPGGGVWQYRVMRGAELTSCGMQSERAVYSWYTVHLENLSKDTLTCSAKLTCGGRQCFPTTSTSAKSVLSPKGQATVIRACMLPEDMYQIEADCQVRPARTPLKIPPNCKFEPVGGVQLESAYPVASRRLREQGPVDLAFTLKESEGVPSDAAVLGSSLSPRIDEAALAALRSLRMRTNCPGTRFEMRLNFELDADGRGTVSTR
jgi:TonB family protein